CHHGKVPRAAVAHTAPAVCPMGGAAREKRDRLCISGPFFSPALLRYLARREPVGGALSLRRGRRSGRGQIDHRLGQALVERDVRVRVVGLDEGAEADVFQLVEGGKAALGGLAVALMAERGEYMDVLLTREAIGVSDHGVDGGAHSPAGVLTSKDGPGV